MRAFQLDALIGAAVGDRKIAAIYVGTNMIWEKPRWTH
jgi:hypothetical protein